MNTESVRLVQRSMRGLGNPIVEDVVEHNRPVKISCLEGVEKSRMANVRFRLASGDKWNRPSPPKVE